MVVTGRRAAISFDPGRGAPSIKTVLEGEASWQTPEGRYAVSPDTFLILNEDQEYGLRSSANWMTHTFCVFFMPEDLQEAGKAIGMKGDVTGFYERLQLLRPEVGHVLGKVREVARAGESEGLEGECALADLVMTLVSLENSMIEAAGIHTAKSSVREELFRQLNLARDYALANLSKPLGLNELSGVAAMSPFHFHRVHRQAFGETPHDFVTRARISRASRLLAKGLDVEDVTLALGFESAPSFCRLFKAKTGMTPGRYRVGAL